MTQKSNILYHFIIIIRIHNQNSLFTFPNSYIFFYFFSLEINKFINFATL